MEAVGLVASIITIVDVSWKIVGYLQGFKHGDKARRDLLEEVTQIWLVFDRLKEDLDVTEGSLSEESWVQPLKILGGPDGIAAQVSQHLSNLEAKLTKRDGRFGGAVSAIRWPFQEKEALRIVAQLDKLKQTSQLVLQQSSHRMNREIRDDVGGIRSAVDDARFQKILNWLTPINFVRKQQEILGSTDPCDCPVLGSKTWFKSFLLWRRDDLRYMWLYGSPGAGKSVIAASVYAQLIRQSRAENIAVLCAFCSFDDEDSQSPRNVVASLLKQALQVRGNAEVSPKLEEYFARAMNQNEELLDLPSLTELLREELKTYNASFIMLDGLDEVSDLTERAAMLRVIHNIGAGVKIGITSRYSEDIYDTLKAIQSCGKCLNTQAKVYWRDKNDPDDVSCDQCHSKVIPNAEDEQRTARELRWKCGWYQPKESAIRDYVAMRIDSDREIKKLIGSDTDQESIRTWAISTITQKSEKIFLLARLHMDCLVDCLTVGELKRALNDLAGDLDQLYFKSLERMESSLRPKHQKIVKKLLLWVAWGRRPFSVDELGHALAIRPGIEEIVKDDILPVRDIITWSAGLLFIDCSNLVRFIHPTTGQFFVSRKTELYPRGDSIIAHDCLHYLGMNALREPVTGPDQRSLFKLRCKTYPLVDYAIRFCFKHVSASQEESDDLHSTVYLRSEARRAFVQALYYLHPGWLIATEAPALHIATYLGLTNVMFKVLEGGEGVDAKDPDGATPLMLAAAKGDDALLQLQCLLEAGADPSITCNIGSTALIRAIDSNAEAIVARLVQEPDIDINAVPFDATPAIHRAVTLEASSRILEMLVYRKDLNINQKENRGKTALAYAIAHSNTRALKHILAHEEVDVASTGPDKWSYMHDAAKCGYDVGVALLLKHGADINSRNVHKVDALMIAAYVGHLQVAKLLIKRGIDLRHRDCMGKSALRYAAGGNSWNVLSYLLSGIRQGIDIDAQDNEGQTALHIVCMSRDPYGSRLLLNAGASRDIKNDAGRTPAEFAFIFQGCFAPGSIKSGKDYQEAANIRKALGEAIQTESSEAVQAMIATATPAEINSPLLRVTPLSEACFVGRVDVIRMLL